MTYVLLVLAVAGAFLWSTPAKDTVVANVSRGIHSAKESWVSGHEPITDGIASASAFVRTKAMELLRKELHRSVDGLVK